MQSKIIEYEFNRDNLLLNRNYISDDLRMINQKNIQIQEYETALIPYKKNLKIYSRLFNRLESVRQSILTERKDTDLQNALKYYTSISVSEEELQSILEALKIAKKFIMQESNYMKQYLESVTNERQKANILKKIEENKIRLQNFDFIQNHIADLPILNNIINPILISCVQEEAQIFVFTWYFDIQDKMPYIAQYSYDKSKLQWFLRSIMHQDIGYCPLCKTHSTGSENTDICYSAEHKPQIYIQKDIIDILLDLYKNELPEEQQKNLFASGIIRGAHR